MACTYTTVDYNMGDVGIRKNMQRVVLNYKSTGSVKDVDMTLVYDYGDDTAASPAVYDLQDPLGATFYGSAKYGTTASGGSDDEYGSTQFIPLYRQSVEGSGFAVALKFTDTSANPTYTLKGFSLEYTPGARM